MGSIGSLNLAQSTCWPSSLSHSPPPPMPPPRLLAMGTLLSSTAGTPTPPSTLRSASPPSPTRSPPSSWPSRRWSTVTTALTVCEETSTVVDREICTYVYEKEDVTAPCTTTQVTYEDKSETMKVTACGAAGYGYGHQGYGQGEHQVCREEYQTQAYKVPLVTYPLEVSCSLSYPAPKEVCVTKSITITEVVCVDKTENVCFNVAKFVDATNTVEQIETIIGEPSCEQITLSLPTQSCSKAHHAPAYHHGK